MAKSKLYQCVGENFKNGVNIGFCGDVHTLDKWIELLFADKPEQAKEFFSGDSDKYICDYILTYKGKRLKVYKSV